MQNGLVHAHLLRRAPTNFGSINSHCSPSDLSQPLHGPLPLHLRLLLWDCPSECDYTCQRQITNRFRAENLPLHQFHGKWPFLRLWGIQEPLDRLFAFISIWDAGRRRQEEEKSGSTHRCSPTCQVEYEIGMHAGKQDGR